MIFYLQSYQLHHQHGHKASLEKIISKEHKSLYPSNAFHCIQYNSEVSDQEIPVKKLKKYP